MMNPFWKKFWTVSAKHAVNAVLTNMTLGSTLPDTFNFHGWAGILAYLKAAGAVILSRECIVWGPKILKWSMTDIDNGNGNGNDNGSNHVQP